MPLPDAPLAALAGRLGPRLSSSTADRALQAMPAPGPILGEVGDGHFDAILLVNPAGAGEKGKAKAQATRRTERSLRQGGSISGEHGAGLGKLPLTAAEDGAATTLMGHIKRALDPHDLMNPGKLLPQPKVR